VIVEARVQHIEQLVVALECRLLHHLEVSADLLPLLIEPALHGLEALPDLFPLLVKTTIHVLEALPDLFPLLVKTTIHVLEAVGEQSQQELVSLPGFLLQRFEMAGDQRPLVVEAPIDGLETHCQDGQELLVPALHIVQTLIDAIEATIDGIEALIDAIEATIDGIEALIDGIEALIDGIEALIDAVEALIEHVEAGSELLVHAER